MSGRKGPKRAAALRYDPQAGGAPKVVAVGAGTIAERIVELAREQGVPVREEPALAEALARLELEQEIPPELFVAVAEVLVWAYGLEAKRRPTAPR
ncbi:MAG TPA: EscU/YscU/HrcU family type III secretion system export apparatus switch protein [Baekduia sp.]|uniref:EscU/YscU/HrcU family type III secretion system export apparatus switch protein n=1 Tax=Baekduia sp. TaxID=2600305 RepID=UPI002BFEA74F|nr:EscU/YscU/HrcU family type III secretion system export apparatus switch protein [Baekduia sp.]HMJ37913.1 EscU/YscU/HrcU family type III secretion system export apparatus switch protein [Baekduia sp.]